MQEKSDFLFIGHADNIKFFRNGVNGFSQLFLGIWTTFLGRKSSILGYINKMHFWWERSCTVVLSVFSRSSVGKIREGIREVKEWAILIKVLF